MTIPVFFRDEQVAPAQGYSPSAAKPAQVMAEWERQGFPIERRSFLAESRATLGLAHSRSYVDAVLDCREDNGFGTKDRALADSLPFTSGSMTAAALHAWRFKSVAVSPTSGFHHAGWDYGSGFCTFNGLMVAARTVLKNGAKRVAILDCDQHYGDGTDNILDRLRDNSHSHGASIKHLTMGGEGLRRGQAQKYITTVREALGKWAKERVELVLFQAGADPHVNDPLGGLLTSEEMRKRDLTVFMECKRLGLPVAWNLAGGYQRDENGGIQPVLDIHNATMQECVAVYGGD